MKIFKMGNKPSSVAHYTSWEVLHIMLKKSLENKDAKLTFHLSLINMMNDYREGEYVLSRYFSNSNLKTNLKKQWDDQFYPTHKPFILSTVRTDKNSIGYGSLPMWKMYGDDFKGCFIRFNHNKLELYCKENNLIFKPCVYKNTAEVSNLISKFNSEKTEFYEILKESCLTKHTSWEYEHEWRIISVVSDINTIMTKTTNRGIIEYVELKIPLSFVDEICLGPKSNQNNYESLSTILKQLKEIDQNLKFGIKESKISIN